MKKYIVFVLSLLIVISLTACASETDTAQNNFVEIYKTKATEYIENGDTQAAIDALEEGVEKTGNAELQQMLDELNEEPNTEDNESNSGNGGTDSEDSISSNENTSSDTTNMNSQDNPTSETVTDEPFNIDDYIGWWSEVDVYTNGGMVIYIYDDGENYLQIYIESSRQNGYQIADALFMVLKETVRGNKIEGVYEDSFENVGFASIEFAGDKVICTISNVKESGYNWGIYAGEYILTEHTVEY